jgi:hypothetical protein
MKKGFFYGVSDGIDCFQLKSLSCDRFVRKIGSLDTIHQPYIQLKMMLVLGLKV